MNRISEDVGKVRMYFGPAIMYSINTIALFIIVISYMLSVAPKLTFYTLLPLPILSFLIYKLNKAIHQKSTIVQEMLSKISSFDKNLHQAVFFVLITSRNLLSLKFWLPTNRTLFISVVSPSFISKIKSILFWGSCTTLGSTFAANLPFFW